MPAPYEFTIESLDTETEEEARTQVWAVAQQHVGMDRYTDLSDLTLVRDGYRVVEGIWVRYWTFTVEAT